MARLAVSHNVNGTPSRMATTTPSGDIVVDIDLTKITSISQLRVALNAVLLAFQSGKELTSS